MDLLTGQNKSNFKAWYANWQEQNDYYTPFHKLPFSMQEGVLKAYYRSFGYFPEVIHPFETTNSSQQFHSICRTNDKYYFIDSFDDFDSAAIASLEVTNDLLNSKLPNNSSDKIIRAILTEELNYTDLFKKVHDYIDTNLKNKCITYIKVNSVKLAD